VSKLVSTILVILGILAVLISAIVLLVQMTMFIPKMKSVSKSVPVGTEFPNAISVNGMGEVYVKPELANISIGVESRAKTAGEASDQNKRDMNQVMSSLKAMGIKDEDIQTTDYSIYPDYRYTENEGEKMVGYIVRNMVQVKVKDIDKIGDILDAATGAGANAIHGIRFTVEDPNKYKDEARKLAVEEAKSKAQKLANCAGVKLGDVLSIREEWYEAEEYYMYEEMAAFEGKGGAPISPGQLAITAMVQMQYEIVQ